MDNKDVFDPSAIRRAGNMNDQVDSLADQPALSFGVGCGQPGSTVACRW